MGEQPDDWKPMPSVGPGTIELRIHRGTAHRVIVVTKFTEAILLHAFVKKSQKTARRDIELARQRYREVIRGRGNR
jgi:phage-related protein